MSRKAPPEAAALAEGERSLQLALELVRQRMLSHGKAAELLGPGQAEFIRCLADHQVSIFQFTPDELRGEVEGGT